MSHIDKDKYSYLFNCLTLLFYPNYGVMLLKIKGNENVPLK